MLIFAEKKRGKKGEKGGKKGRQVVSRKGQVDYLLASCLCSSIAQRAQQPACQLWAMHPSAAPKAHTGYQALACPCGPALCTRELTASRKRLSQVGAGWDE